MADWSELRVKGKFTNWRVGVASGLVKGVTQKKCRVEGQMEGDTGRRQGSGKTVTVVFLYKGKN